MPEKFTSAECLAIYLYLITGLRMYTSCQRVYNHGGREKHRSI